MINWKSTCCQAETKVVGGDEGTNHYECLNCGQPCNATVNPQGLVDVDLPTPTTPAGEKECSCDEPWIKGVIHRRDRPCYWPPRDTPTPDQKWEARWDFIWGEAPPDSIKYQKGQEIKAFITSLLAEARAEERVKALLEARACIAMSMAALIDNYKGKLPFVVFGGKADDKEKMTIYEQAIKDAHGWITQMMPITHLQASDKGK